MHYRNTFIDIFSLTVPLKFTLSLILKFRAAYFMNLRFVLHLKQSVEQS